MTDEERRRRREIPEPRLQEWAEIEQPRKRLPIPVEIPEAPRQSPMLIGNYLFRDGQAFVLPQPGTGLYQA